MISLAELDELAGRGWPALDTTDVDGWTVRRSGGVTQRANSVLPLAGPPDPVVAIRRVEELYREHGLRPIFQLSPASEPAGLDDLLDRAGYEFRAPTSVMVADVATVLDRLPPHGLPVRTADAPDKAWMDLWWSVDGRGDDDARAVARRILTGGPALYTSILDEHGPAAVARLALVGTWGGVYCMAVRPDARRRGLAGAVLRTLLQAAPGVGHTWLQVLADNQPAQALYTRAGYTPASQYHYRLAPTRRGH